MFDSSLRHHFHFFLHLRCAISQFMDQVNLNFSSQEYLVGSINQFDQDLYNQLSGFPEAEHQIGRYLNMRSVAEEIKANSISGDVLEFGTFQGTGLILLTYGFGHDVIDRKFIGIDSFEGLPETSTIWAKETFSDTSFDLVKTNLERWCLGTKNRQISLIKAWFKDPCIPLILERLVNNVSLVHFDADLGSSTLTALKIVEAYLIHRRDPMYFLFDDWGCHPDEVPDAFLSWLEGAKATYGISATKICSTKLTRYYRITFQ